MYHDFNYEATLSSSLRAQWHLDDVLRPDQNLDFPLNFMPDSLARTAAPVFRWVTRRPQSWQRWSTASPTSDSHAPSLRSGRLKTCSHWAAYPLTAAFSDTGGRHRRPPDGRVRPRERRERRPDGG